jgi:dipeptidyl aminopeptidase/acylaminoacyl peptidase
VPDHTGRAAKESVPFGTWVSPISAETVAEASVGFGAVAIDANDVYWLESRPREEGRSVIVRYGCKPADLTPATFDVRSRVHEYGGGAFHIRDGVAYFTNFADQGLYRQAVDSAPERITVSDGLRYADFASQGRRLYCVREDHRNPGTPVNGLVCIDLDSLPDDGRLVWQQSDFVAYPSLSTDGDRLAWIAWDFPNMPWDNVALWIADLAADGSLRNARRLNVGIEESVLQPVWASDGALYFIADRGGWWNLYRYQGGTTSILLEMQADFGGPLWMLGASYFALISEREALVRYATNQGETLARLDLVSGALEPFDLPYTGYASLQTRGREACFIATRLDAPNELVEVNVDTGTHRTLAVTGERPFDAGFLSVPDSLEFPTDGGDTAFAYYYPPSHPTSKGPADAAPPMIVEVHGGPTSATLPAYSVSRHFWSSRGFAVLDVNYGGSTGYGRAFRQRLNGQWGIVDLRDTINAARYAVEKGLADPDRLAIHGGSAGGFLVLAALAFDDTFSVGANYFGVSDLEMLAVETHKFESRYLDLLVGPYPEMKDVYIERSPIHNLDGFARPLITLQGLDDRIVPPSQSERIYEALRERGVPVAMLTFEGESHGFRKAETRARALEAELYFYGRVLGLEPAGHLKPLPIANLD